MNDETKNAIEAELDRALQRLPANAAPAALRRRLEALVAPAVPRRERPRAGIFAAAFTSACAAAVLVLVATRVTRPGPPEVAPSDLVTEAVNDHLRVVSSTHPVEIESGGIHQVKPWFTGRLEFAPRVSFSGDADFPLVGGAIGYFRDRKAAVFVFRRRLHTVTLLVLPPGGLGWPDRDLARVGRLSVSETSARGFSVLMWREGDLGYALISDVNVHDLETLANKINGD